MITVFKLLVKKEYTHLWKACSDNSQLLKNMDNKCLFVLAVVKKNKRNISKLLYSFDF